MKLKPIDTEDKPCDGNMPRLSGKELQERKSLLKPEWRLKGEESLEREFKFPDFRTALGFTNAIGAEAEAINHHPDVYLTYGKVRIELSTHSTGGLTECDFRLAAKIDELQFSCPGASDLPAL